MLRSAYYPCGRSRLSLDPGPHSAPGSFVFPVRPLEIFSRDGSRVGLRGAIVTCVTSFPLTVPLPLCQPVVRITQSNVLDELRSVLYPCSHVLSRGLSLDRTAPPSLTPLGAVPLEADNSDAPSTTRQSPDSSIFPGLPIQSLESIFLFTVPRSTISPFCFPQSEHCGVLR